jgi:hypothetical protein
MPVNTKAFWDERYAANPGVKDPSAINQQIVSRSDRGDRLRASLAKHAAERAAKKAGFAGVEPGGGFPTPPGGVGVSAPGLQMDGETPQAFPRPAGVAMPAPPRPMPPPVQGRPAVPQPMPGQAAPAPGGLPSNLPVPPGGGGGGAPGMAGTPGQTGAPVQASPLAGVRPMRPPRSQPAGMEPRTSWSNLMVPGKRPY